MSEFKEYKIRVNETESKVAQELFFKLGYKWPFTGQHVVWLSKPWLSTGITGQIYWHEENQSEDFYRCKLITLEQLGELAGHRIDGSLICEGTKLETLDKLENHISPNCEVKNG
ncbi:hypothetical protein ACOCHT_15970 [Acinetobacter baumannii]|uniref:hypothetical protein n=1 Tax=Acinetobacter baumannii TaxID=470 RepID=UPI003B433A6A